MAENSVQMNWDEGTALILPASFEVLDLSALFVREHSFIKRLRAQLFVPIQG